MCALAVRTFGAGSGLNTVVIVNQISSNSCALGNYYAERRQVPPDNVLRISWAGANISWTSAEFQTSLLNPLLSMLATRQLTNQIDYVVLSMDIPFQTLNGPVVNGTTSALFYGLKTNSGPEAANITNSYAASEAIFRTAKPATAPGYSFLTTMLTADSLAQAMQLVDQGVASDGTFPSGTVVLAKSSDYLRNVRYHEFDNVMFNTRIRGRYAMRREDSDSPSGQTNLLGYQTGLANFSISPGTFVPGAMADSLTSYGGVIFGPSGQTSLLAFIYAGASGSYGTVTEPSPDTRKFPDPQVYFYQSRGFSLAEAYYQSISIPYQGLIVGEPLAAPFAATGSGQWIGIASNAVLSGVAPLTVRFASASADCPLQQVDLFVDGKYYRTISNAVPLRGNSMKLTVNGFPVNYSVPANATLASIAAGLTSLINSAVNSNSSITAQTFGDRIELRSGATTVSNRPSPPGEPRGPGVAQQSASGVGLSRRAPFFANSQAGSAAALTTFVSARRSVLVDSEAFGIRECSVSGTLQSGTWLGLQVIKTNGVAVTVCVTNQSANATPFDLSSQLAASVNAAPALQDSDGIVIEDLASGFFSMGLFNVRARSDGLEAAAVRVTLIGSPSLVVNPSSAIALNDNLSDLQPRNHLYVTAGASHLNVGFQLDTTALADGFHELTAVAYEGSHVRTQTRVSLPVRVQNSTLNATLAAQDLTDPASVQGTFHFQVTANAVNVGSITLLSTGGMVASVPNQATATFAVPASLLGAGLHPFYAIIQTTTGGKYRTETLWVRFVN
jgi:uncharacterized protein (TIGR03790 family)